jgi:hypothetical protein
MTHKSLRLWWVIVGGRATTTVREPGEFTPAYWPGQTQ